MYSYGNHNPNYDSLILKCKPKYLVDNPPHGLYGEMQGYDCEWLLHDITTFRNAGIKVFGYMTGGYEGRKSNGKIDPHWYSLNTNLKIIKQMAEIDCVDGVFIDECTDYPDIDSKSYLMQITDYARYYNLIVWGNVGVDQFDEWYFYDGGFDLMQSTEDWNGQILTKVQRDWGHRITVSGNRPWYTLQNAIDLTVDALDKGLSYCYITNRQYTSIAPWFEHYSYALKGYHIMSPI